MKKITLLLSGVFAISSLAAQIAAQKSETDDEVQVIKCVEFHISKPLSELAELYPYDEDMEAKKEKKQSKDREGRIPQTFLYNSTDGPEYMEDPSVRQADMGNRQPLAPLTSWAGLGNGSLPPDPSGAAGTNYYVQAANATPLKVFNKSTGANVLTTNIGALFGSTINDGDPIILYDKTADRWVVTQFGDNYGSSGNFIHIAISTTNNPAGTYYTYTFTSPSFPDYLKFSVWWDGYYMASNQAQKIFVFERDQMLLGNAASRGFYKTYSPPQGGGFFCPLTADADGLLPAVGTPCPILSYSDNGWGGGNTDAIKIYKMTVNWVPTTPSATIVLDATVPLNAFDASYESSWNDISQPAGALLAGTITTLTTSTTVTGTGTTFTTQFAVGDKIMVGTAEVGQIASITNATTLILKANALSANTAAGFKKIKMLDGIGGVLTYRAPWRKWTGYNSVVLNFGVKLSTTQRSIRWVELRQDQGTLAWTKFQEGTYAPDSKSRWVGSIAMDDNGSIGLCYARSSSAAGDFASLAYTGRLATDPLGTMSFAETTAIAGTSIQSSANRFGDYSQTSLDPDGITFWHTGEYIAAGSKTRIYSFKLPLAAVGIEENQNNPKLTVYQSGTQLNVKGINLGSDDVTMIDLFDITGRQITGKTIVPSSQSIETSFDVSALSSGAYFVRIGRVNTTFQKVVKVIVTK